MSDESKEVTSFDEVDVSDSNLLTEQLVEKPPEAPEGKEVESETKQDEDEVKDPEPSGDDEGTEKKQEASEDKDEKDDKSDDSGDTVVSKFTVDGKEYTEEELQTALTDSVNKTDWQKVNTEKAQEIAELREAVEPTKELRNSIEPVLEFINKLKGDTDLFLEIKEIMVEKHGVEIASVLDAAFKFDVDKYPNPYKTELEAKEQDNEGLRSEIALSAEKLKLKAAHKLKDAQVDEVVNSAVEKFNETGQALTLEDAYKLMDYEVQVKKATEKQKPVIPNVPSKKKGAKDIKKADKLPEKFADISVEDADLFKKEE